MEVFGMTTDGTLRQLASLAGLGKPNDERGRIAQMSLPEVEKYRAGLVTEHSKLMARIKVREQANEDPRNSNADGARANDIAMGTESLLAVAHRRIYGLKQAAAKAAQVKAAADALAADPLAQEAQAAHAAWKAAQARYDALLVALAGSKDDKGNAILPLTGEAREDAEDQRVTLRREVRTLAEAHRIVNGKLRLRKAQDSVRRIEESERLFSAQAPKVVKAAQTLLAEHAKLSAANMLKKQLLPNVATQVLKQFIQRFGEKASR